MSSFRLIFISTIFVLLYGVLVYNLYSIQIRKGQEYVARAESQLQANYPITAPRGGIYFSDKNNSFIPAALNKEYYEIYAVPTEISDPNELAAILSPIVGLSQSKLSASLSKDNDEYELLINKATESQLASIQNLGLTKKGVYYREKTFRYYPLADLASHLIGFVGPAIDSDDNTLVGLYGIEKYFDDRLRGQSGYAEGDKVMKPIPGTDVYLTIDRNIQSQAETILKNLVIDFNAEGGSIIVADPKTGRLLAMVNYPTFDPNSYFDYPISNFLNPAVQSIYEPGSIFKVITMAIGIHTGSITPDTTYIDTGSVTLNGRTINNWDLTAYGRQTMTNVIEKSLNTGTVFAEQQIGHAAFIDHLLRFQFDQPTGITLPGEISGGLGSLVSANAQDIHFATASFGQGISITPLAMLQAISTLANDGVMMRPLIGLNEKPDKVRQVVSKEAADAVTAMMVSAVDKAIIASIPGYSIAGKTGTAQVPDFKRGGYTKDVINTYAGFAPADNPHFTILVKLDKPAGAPLAGQTVVPAFKELAQFIINYYNIPPDRL